MAFKTDNKQEYFYIGKGDYLDKDEHENTY